MTYHVRPATAPDDLNRLRQLLLTCRAAGYVRRYPTVARLEVLYTSRVWDPGQDTWLWENETGQPIAGALLWKRSPAGTFYALERIIHPAQDVSALSEMILNQTKQRIMTEVAARETTIQLGVMPLACALAEDSALLERHGFQLQTDGHNVYMAVDLSQPTTAQPLADSAPADDFTIRPLQTSDLHRYQAAYGFTAVKLEHLKAQLASQEYQQFIAEAPDGSFAGYLECSYSRQEWAQPTARVGWIDYIETLPEFQHKGVGLTLMLTGLRQIRAWGGQTALLITASANGAAQSLFRKAGMHLESEEHIYLQHFDFTASSR